MEKLVRLELLDCIHNLLYVVKVTKEIFDLATEDTTFATKLLNRCIKEECYVFDGPLETYNSSEIKDENQFPPDTGESEADPSFAKPSTSFEENSAGTSFKPSKAKKLLGKSKTSKDHNKSTNIKNWSRNETLLLIAAYKEHQLDFLDSNVSKDDTWTKIANEVNESLALQDLPPIGEDKCRTKWDTLKRHYKRLKDTSKKSGSAPITWAYYDEMEEVFGEQPWIKPLSTAGSNTANKMDLEMIEPPRKRQKNLTNYCEELLAAKKENCETRKQHHREKIESIAQSSGALSKLVDFITKGHGNV